MELDLAHHDMSSSSSVPKGTIVISGYVTFIPPNANKIVHTLLIHSTDDYSQAPVQRIVIPRRRLAFSIQLRPRARLLVPAIYLIVRLYGLEKGEDLLMYPIAEGWVVYEESHRHTELSSALLKTVKGTGATFASRALPLQMQSPKPAILSRAHDSSIGEILLELTEYRVDPQLYQELVSPVLHVFSAKDTISSSLKAKIASETRLIDTLYIAPQHPLLKRINCLNYLNDITAIFGDVPALAFFFGPEPNATIEFWYLLQKYLHWRGTMSLYKDLPSHYLLPLMAAHLITFLPEWLGYVHDVYLSADNFSIPIDYFMNALAVPTKADDCDGSTRATIGCARALRKIPSLIPCEREVMANTLLCRCAAVIRNYVTCAVLAGAYEGKINLEDPEGTYGSAEKPGYLDTAHICTYLIPVKYFIECVRRYDPKHPVAQLDSAAFMSNLPILMCDGTDRIDPYGIKDPALSYRAQFFTPEIQSRVATDLFYQRERGDGFVRWPIMLYTTDFIDALPEERGLTPINVGSFYICQRYKQQYTKGVQQKHFMTAANDIYLIPGTGYSKVEIDYMRAAAAMATPVITLKPPKDSGPLQHPALEKLCVLVNNRGVIAGTPTHVFWIYIKDGQLSNGLGDSLLRMAHKRTRIKNISYHREAVVDGIAGYSLQISVQ